MEQITERNYNLIKKEISEKYNFDENQKENFMIPADYLETLREKFEIVNIHKEEFNKILLQKYILHMFIVLAGHGFIFFYAPMVGNYNLNQ